MTAKFPALTSLRFFAAWTVVAYHAAGQGKMPASWLDWTLPAQAVSVFFVLSGFVLQWSHRGGPGGVSAPAFLARRFARIWPLHAFVVLAVLAAMPSQGFSGDPLRALALVHAWSSDAAVFFWRGNTPSWSLSVELAFYLVFPFLTGYARRRPLLFAATALLWLAGYVALRHPDDQIQRFAAFSINPLARLPEFMFGMCAARALPALARVKFPRWVWTAAEAGALAGIVGLNIAVATSLPWLAGHFGADAAEWARAAGCAPAAVAAITVLAVGRGSLSRALAWRPLVWLGEASFAAYLVHWPLLSLSLPGGIAGYVFAVFDVMVLTHVLIEKPALAGWMRIQHRIWRTQGAVPSGGLRPG